MAISPTKAKELHAALLEEALRRREEEIDTALANGERLYEPVGLSAEDALTLQERYIALGWAVTCSVVAVKTDPNTPMPVDTGGTPATDPIPSSSLQFEDPLP